MTTNPTRPATGQVIATTWGASVADTVIRRFANAASRDADLTGHTAADMLGQVVTLTDTGALLQHVGPVMGWRRPWNLPWGWVVSAESNSAASGDGSIQNIVTSAQFEAVAGRRYRVSAGITFVSGSISATAKPYLGASLIGSFRINHPTPEGAVYTGERFVTIGSTVATQTASLKWQCTTGGLLATNGDPSHWIAVEDVGPAVSAPTLLEDDGNGGARIVAPELERLSAQGLVLLG